VDGHSWELKKQLILLTVVNLLVVSNDLKALLHHIYALIVRRHIAKMHRNIFKILELVLEEEEAPLLRVVREEATAGGEVVR
jgi:hypothetical protein